MTTVQRRLGVIVCADVVSNSQLTHAGDARPELVLKAHREAIDPLFIQEGGRLVKSNGHGAVFEFPNAFDAAHASIEVQRLMAERNADTPVDQRLAFRLGIHRGDVVVEDDDVSGDGINIAARLQEIADPGGICLSRAAHAAIHKDLDTLFPDGGTKALKDVAAPVHVYNLALDALPTPAMIAPVRLLSLVVLPFVNATGESRYDLLADSVTDQLTSELARIEDSFVVDRKTALTHRGDTPDLAALGRALGIRYAIKGRVCAAGEGLRVDAELIDAENGKTAWNGGFDLAIGDLFVMQHDVNARLVPPLYANLLSVSGHVPALQPASPSWQTAAADPAPAQPAPEMNPYPRAPYPSAIVSPMPLRPEPRLPAQPALAPAPRVLQRIVATEAVQSAPVPPMVIHPRPIAAPASAAIRLVAPVPAETQAPPPTQASAPARPHAAPMVEMPTPRLSDSPGRRIPLLWRLFVALVFAGVAGGIAVALLGIQLDTVVEIASWMLIAAGVSLAASAFVEWGQPEVGRRPAQQRPAEGGVIMGRGPPPTTETVTFRATPRVPPSIFYNTRRVPRR